MLDNLKDHIKDQREEFEIYPFEHEAGWAEIADSFAPAKKWTRWKIVSAAACVALMVMGVMVQLPTVDERDELSEVELFYETEINHKISLVKTHLEDPAVLEDLELIDQAFAELKADLKDNVDNEEVVSAMMENYQLKLRILEEILNELEQENEERIL